MKTFKFLSLILCLLLLLTLLPVPAAALTPPTVSAPTALVLDRRGGNPVYAKNADVQVYPASTTKIMTVLLAVEAIERGELSADETITVPADALKGLSEEGSSAGLLTGELLTLRQVLYCAMLASANEAANVIAIRLAGSTSAFAAKMNERAAALGCTGTHFTNAHGLPDEAHYTTASDMGRIALEALRHPLFAEICATAEYEVPATNLTGVRKLFNTNALLSDGGIYGAGYRYAGAVGVKTGHTTAAGYCLAAAADRGDEAVLTLLFGCADAGACFRDASTLFDWTFSNHSYREIYTVSDCVKTVPVRDGDTMDTVELCPAQDVTLLLPDDLDLGALQREVTVYGLDATETLAGPITPGAVLGSIRFLSGGTDYGSVDLVPASSAALIMDRKSGEILYGKGLDNRVYPADTVKLMTALLAVEAAEAGRVSLNDMVTVTEAMVIDLDEDSTLCGLQVGEQITLGSLLQCALIASGDDAANVVADYVGGSVPDFVALMNARAADLGCAATSFSNVHGAYSAEQYTTARDFSRIVKECLRHDRLTRICGTVVAELTETNLTPARTLRNTNALICDESVYGADYLYEDADGLKTGYNARAGYALIATASRNGVDLLCEVFGGVKDEEGFSAFRDTITLFDRIFDNYAYQEVLKSTENIASVDVALGMDASYVNLRPATSIIVLLPNSYNLDEFEKHIRVYALENGETVTAPVTAGQVLGEVTLTREGKDYGTVKLVASASVQLSRLQYIRSQIRETTQQRKFRTVVAVLASLFFLYLVWVLIYRIKRLRHLHAVRVAERERALRAEAAMKAAPELKSPGIRFFNERGQTSAPEPLPAAEPEPEPEAPAAPEPLPAAEPEPLDPKIVSLFPRAAQPKEAAPEPEAPVPEETDDLLAGAVLVAKVEPEPPKAETPEEKAERDYFEEFFRPKK